MAAYATTADLVQLAISAAALGNVSLGDQEAALEAASRLADSYLGSRFELPISAWGADLKQQVCSLAAYRIMQVRGYSPETGDAEVFRDNYDDAIRWLERVASGTVTPINVVDSSDSPGNTTDATGNARERPFVVQPVSDSCSAGGFWERDGVTVSPGGVGASRKRGW